MDRVENDVIRERMGVVKVHQKVQEKRLRWYGHVLRKQDTHVTRRTLKMEVEGKRRQGRPLRRWME